MSKVHIIITTYERPEMLRELLTDIHVLSQFNKHELTVQVFDDCSQQSYTSVLSDFKKRLAVQYHKGKERCGKRGYWRLLNGVFATLPRDKDYYFFLQDDVRLIGQFFDNSIELWNAIVDSKKVVLNLFNDDQRRGQQLWTYFHPKKYNSYLGSVWDMGWVDMAAFMCEAKFFDALNWELRSIHPVRWKGNEKISSGVGEQISQRLYKKNSLWQVDKSFVYHGDHISQMHPWREQALVSNG